MLCANSSVHRNIGYEHGGMDVELVLARLQRLSDHCSVLSVCTLLYTS